MSPMVYDEAWRPPARETVLARCRGRLCVADGLPGTLVVAATLTVDGLCANCARTPANIHPGLDSQPEEPEPTLPVADAVREPMSAVQLELL